MKKKALSLFLAFLITTSLLYPVSLIALSIDSHYQDLYDGEYSSNTGQYIVNIAYANRDRYLRSIYNADWCAMFACDCCRKAGVSKNIVPSEQVQ